MIEATQDRTCGCIASAILFRSQRWLFFHTTGEDIEMMVVRQFPNAVRELAQTIGAKRAIRAFRFEVETFGTAGAERWERNATDRKWARYQTRVAMMSRVQFEAERATVTAAIRAEEAAVYAEGRAAALVAARPESAVAFEMYVASRAETDRAGAATDRAVAESVR